MECIEFLGSSEQHPECEGINLGPDIGMVNVFQYNDVENNCQLSMQELASVCKDFFQECLNFLASSEQAPQVIRRPPLCGDIRLAG